LSRYWEEPIGVLLTVLSPAPAPADISKLVDVGFRRSPQAGELDCPGRVVAGYAPVYRVQTATGVETAHLPGLARTGSISAIPIVGDWVGLDHSRDKVMITRVMERRTVVRRMTGGYAAQIQHLAANVDVVFVCLAPSVTSPTVIEGYLGMAWSSGAIPVVVLTKRDLATPSQIAALDQLTAAVALDVEILWTSTSSGVGLDRLRRILSEGTTGVFLGPSGAGKSTLVNALAEAEVNRTGAINTRTNEGRHTTTARELFVLPHGGVVIDTPGIRTVQPFPDLSASAKVFSDVTGFVSRCRFDDCTHTVEPGCAVVEAIESGQLEPSRLLRHRQMVSESESCRLMIDESALRRQQRSPAGSKPRRRP
jgi:ribosome biogenesis GTPase